MWRTTTLPGSDGNLSQAVEQHGRRQSHKSHHGAVQELKLAHQHVGGLGARRDLLHEVEVNLCGRAEGNKNKHVSHQMIDDDSHAGTQSQRSELRPLLRFDKQVEVPSVRIPRWLFPT